MPNPTRSYGRLCPSTPRAKWLSDADLDNPMEVSISWAMAKCKQLTPQAVGLAAANASTRGLQRTPAQDTRRIACSNYFNGVMVEHIFPGSEVKPHRTNGAAEVVDGTVPYPGNQRSSTCRACSHSGLPSHDQAVTHVFAAKDVFRLLDPYNPSEAPHLKYLTFML
jgi:hypothetical protein